MEPLGSGMKGFLITLVSSSKEKCTNDVLRVLNDCCRPEDAGSSCGREAMFEAVETKTENVMFIRTSVVRPSVLTRRMLEDAQRKKQADSRYIKKMLPVDGTCEVNDNNAIHELCEKVLTLYFKPDEEMSFKVICSADHCRNTSLTPLRRIRDNIESTVAKISPLAWTHNKYPQLVIHVEIMRNIMCLSVLEDFHKFKKYNIVEVVGSLDWEVCRAVRIPDGVTVRTRNRTITAEGQGGAAKLTLWQEDVEVKPRDNAVVLKTRCNSHRQDMEFAGLCRFVSERIRSVQLKRPVSFCRGLADCTFITEAVNRHNHYRALHGSLKLRTDQKLCDAAQDMSVNLATKNVKDSIPSSIGVNIYRSEYSSSNVHGHTAVDEWYRQVDLFDWTTLDLQEAAASFTQVIWKDCREIGIGKAVGPCGSYVVALYFPAGNRVGSFAENVQPAPPKLTN